ncbi:MAG TPA: glycerophosphodiester phosphodiesterase [Sphaerochaeta sp.]|nr:glycerophosphodiester phosphodiesterase [Sphaerochaeta sp.]
MYKSFFDPLPRVVAHRGDSAHYPENTLPAFESADRLGVDVIETDVHLSKDGQIVVWHDATLDRTTDGKGAISDYTLEELRAFDAGFMFSPDGGKTFPFRGKGVQLCTLEEALIACPTQRFNVDLKSRGEATVDAFIAVVQRQQAKKRVLGASFHLCNLKMLRKKEPRIQTSLCTLEVMRYLFAQKLRILPKTKQDELMVFQVPAAQWGITVITADFIQRMHSRGAIVQVWTINEESEMRRLFAMGVDSVMTDKPELAIKVAEELGLRS